MRTSTPVFVPFETVHASAGSGKTYQLVQRIVYLLLQGADPGGILAITFTRKAAAEMAQRLLQRVRNLSTLDEAALAHELEALGLSATDAHCQRARALYEILLHTPYPVRSTTFHAFCQDLLRRFPMEAAVPPGFELLEVTGQLLDEAWESFSTWLTRHASAPTAQAMDMLLQQLGTTNTKALLYGFLHRRSDWWALTRDQTDPVAFAVAGIEANIPLPGNGEPLHDFFADSELTGQLQQFHTLLGKHPIASHQQAAAEIECGLRPELEDAARLEALWRAFFTSQDEPRARKTSKTLQDKLGADGAEEFVMLHLQLCERLIALRRQLHGVATRELSRAWLQCGNELLNHYQRSKTLQRVLDFTDLEWKSYLLLSEGDHADWIQYKLDQRIEHLLVDEFQDTNPIQWQLLLPLLQELAAGHQTRSRSVLLVGDSKQSIYRFRRAEPRLFDTASDWLLTHLPDARQSTLSKSYRSSPAVINFVNQVFEANAELPLTHFTRHATAHTELWGRVTLLPPAQTGDKQTHDGLRNPLTTPRPQMEAAHYHEAQQIAHAIHELMQAQVMVGRGARQRPLRYADILVLFRSRTAVTDYERALREAHIPYLGTERGTLLDSLEVKDMITLLQWLITPFNNLALAGILRSPLFAASDTDLMQLAGQGNWYGRLQELARTSDPAHPFVRAVQHLQGWLPLADRLPVHDLLDRIYSEGNVLARYQAAFPAHLQPRVTANLTRFLELALETDSGRYPSLTRFIAWLELRRQQDKEAPDQPPGQGEQDRIRLLTVHEAKGLEAPVVFVADASRTPVGERGAHILADWSADGAEPDCFLLSAGGKYPHAYCQQISQRLQDKAAQEEANLLYVALTRAEQLLYVSAAGKADGWYATIASACDIDVASLQAPILVQAHGEPATLQQTAAPAAAEPPVVEPRLREVLEVATRLHEIAPSYLHDWQGGQRRIDDDARERGRVIHALLDLLSRDATLSAAQLAAHFPALAPVRLHEYWREARQVVQDFPTLFDPTHYLQAWSEVPIYYREGQCTVHGIIDRLVCYADRTLIVDYKTQRIAADQFPVLAEAYRPQLRHYAEGIRRAFPQQPVHCQLLLTCVPHSIEISA